MNTNDDTESHRDLGRRRSGWDEALDHSSDNNEDKETEEMTNVWPE